ncbi:hypothetical protein BG006_004451, partial [Podila minutissima]
MDPETEDVCDKGSGTETDPETEDELSTLAIDIGAGDGDQLSMVARSIADALEQLKELVPGDEAIDDDDDQSSSSSLSQHEGHMPSNSLKTLDMNLEKAKEHQCQESSGLVKTYIFVDAYIK